MRSGVRRRITRLGTPTVGARHCRAQRDFAAGYARRVASDVLLGKPVQSMGVFEPWLAVPELHPGGHGWHWHFLVPRRFLRIELAALWGGWTDYLKRHSMEPSGGATYARIDVKPFPNARAAVRYAAKYVGKAFDGYERQKGRRRYLNARGMAVEVVRGGGQSLQTVRWVAEQIGADYIVDSNELDEWHGPPMVFASWDE